MREIKYYCPDCNKPFNKTDIKDNTLMYVCDKCGYFPSHILICPVCLSQLEIVPILWKSGNEERIAYCSQCVITKQFKICASVGLCKNKNCHGVILTDEKKQICRDETCRTKNPMGLENFIFFEYDKKVDNERLLEILKSVFRGEDWPVGLSIDVRYRALHPKVYQLSLFETQNTGIED